MKKKQIATIMAFIMTALAVVPVTAGEAAGYGPEEYYIIEEEDALAPAQAEELRPDKDMYSGSYSYEEEAEADEGYHTGKETSSSSSSATSLSVPAAVVPTYIYRSEIQRIHDEARLACRASALPDEAVVTGEDSDWHIDFDKTLAELAKVSGNDISGNSITMSLTLNKGDKISNLPGYEKKLSQPEPDSTRSIVVSARSVLTAKKVTGDTPVRFSYTHTGTKQRITLKVYVYKPDTSPVTVSGDLTVKKQKSLSLSLMGEGDFDVALTKIPLTTKADMDNYKKKGDIFIYTGKDENNVKEDNYLYVGADGFMHISGHVQGKKSSINIPFMAYGKKYTYRIKARRKKK